MSTILMMKMIVDTHRVCTQPKPKYFGVIATGNHWILIRCAKHHPCVRIAKRLR